MFRRRPGRLLNVLCTFNLRAVSTGYQVYFFSKNLGINWRRANFSDTFTISDSVMFLIAFLMAPKSYVDKALSIDYGNAATN